MTDHVKKAEEYTRTLAAERPQYPENYTRSYHLQAAQGEAMRKMLFHCLMAICDAIYHSK